MVDCSVVEVVGTVVGSSVVVCSVVGFSGFLVGFSVELVVVHSVVASSVVVAVPEAFEQLPETLLGKLQISSDVSQTVPSGQRKLYI